MRTVRCLCVESDCCPGPAPTRRPCAEARAALPELERLCTAGCGRRPCRPDRGGPQRLAPCLVHLGAHNRAAPKVPLSTAQTCCNQLAASGGGVSQPGRSGRSACCDLAAYERMANISCLSCGAASRLHTLKHLRPANSQRIKPQYMISGAPPLGSRCWPASEDCPRAMPSSGAALIGTAWASGRFHACKAPAGPSISTLRRTNPGAAAAGGPAWRLAKPAAAWRASGAVLAQVRQQLVGGVMRTAIRRRQVPGPARGWLFRSESASSSWLGYGLTEPSPVLACRRRCTTAAAAPDNHCPATALKIVDADRAALLTLG